MSKVTVLLNLYLGAHPLLWRGDCPLGSCSGVLHPKPGGVYLSFVGGSILLLGLMMTLGALVRDNPRLPMYVSFVDQCFEITW